MGWLVLLQYKKVAPVGDRVFVKVDDSEATTAGGILLPTSAQKKQTQGEVVDNGDATSLKVGFCCFCDYTFTPHQIWGRMLEQAAPKPARMVA